MYRVVECMAVKPDSGCDFLGWMQAAHIYKVDQSNIASYIVFWLFIILSPKESISSTEPVLKRKQVLDISWTDNQ